MPLQILHRPTEFDEIAGNKSTVASLKAIYDRQSDWPHAVLLQGPKGCGKSTVARIIASKLLGGNANKNDLCQVDGGDIDAAWVRNLKKTIAYKPLMSKARVWIAEEAHMIGRGGSEKNLPQNNLLTTLEEPPPHAYFILCTTDPARLVSTIRSRCHIFEMQNLNNREIAVLLKGVLKKEEVEDIPESILKKIAEVCDGCPRDAVKILDQIIDMDDDKMEGGIAAFEYSEKSVFEFSKALLRGDKWDKLKVIIKDLDMSNPESLRRAVIGMMANSLIKYNNGRAMLVYDAFRTPFYDTGKPGFIFAAYQAMLELQE